MPAQWLDTETPGGIHCVAAARNLPRKPDRKRFVVRYMEDIPGHKFFYDRVIEAETRESAMRLAMQWADQRDDDFRQMEEI